MFRKRGLLGWRMLIRSSSVSVHLSPLMLVAKIAKNVASGCTTLSEPAELPRWKKGKKLSLVLLRNWMVCPKEL